MPTRSAAVCSICYDGIRWDDRLVLPCKHVFCRGCIDHMFLHHHRTADDYASQCPMCRAPLMGEADELFTQGSWCLAGFQRQVELQMHGLDRIFPFEIGHAITAFEDCITAVEGHATGPGGLNRMAAAAQYNIGRCYELRWAAADDLRSDEAQQDARDAMRAYELAFERSHELDGSAANNLGAMLMWQGRPEEAQHWFSRACDLDPADTLARANLRIAARENRGLRPRTAGGRVVR
mmetsp:Transcript_23217/g.70554  ORF Transcript_23217/g.70554 Transcript_23217/m.70554 type:complete len:236 (-) Transcript_23217:53-760(-)